jgi:hypothetical protein
VLHRFIRWRCAYLVKHNDKFAFIFTALKRHFQNLTFGAHSSSGNNLTTAFGHFLCNSLCYPFTCVYRSARFLPANQSVCTKKAFLLVVSYSILRTGNISPDTIYVYVQILAVKFTMNIGILRANEYVYIHIYIIHIP